MKVKLPDDAEGLIEAVEIVPVPQEDSLLALCFHILLPPTEAYGEGHRTRVLLMEKSAAYRFAQMVLKNLRQEPYVS